MLRVCGADGERDRSAQRRCWCGGLFCGKGGHKLSIQFRRAFRTKVPALSRAHVEELIGQADLFAGDEVRELWRSRFNRHAASRV